MEPHDSAFMRELMTVFSAEAEERLATIDQRLVEFERTSAGDTRAALLQDILREGGLIKGTHRYEDQVTTEFADTVMREA